MSISIHALREEGDAGISLSTPKKWIFLSTPSARRATLANDALFAKLKQFLSTPSARRATGCLFLFTRWLSYFYPRPPRGGRQKVYTKEEPREYFYPRPPRGGRRMSSADKSSLAGISIHALREEGDQSRPPPP